MLVGKFEVKIKRGDIRKISVPVELLDGSIEDSLKAIIQYSNPELSGSDKPMIGDKAIINYNGILYKVSKKGFTKVPFKSRR